MIQVQRSIEPAYLAARKVNWLKELRDARKSGNKEKFKKLQGRYGHEKIRSALDKIFESKCAYCESTIEIVASPHIEHFRPKDRYVSLTYDWGNLLLSCPKCNDRGHKGTNFPNYLQGGPLIDPSAEYPPLHLEFLYDPITRLATVKPTTTRGQTTVNTFGLNTRPALLKARSDLLRKLLALKKFDGLNPEVTAILAEARQSNSPYLAWVRKYI